MKHTKNTPLLPITGEGALSCLYSRRPSLTTRGQCYRWGLRHPTEHTHFRAYPQPPCLDSTWGDPPLMLTAEGQASLVGQSHSRVLVGSERTKAVSWRPISAWVLPFPPPPKNIPQQLIYTRTAPSNPVWWLAPVILAVGRQR